LNTPIDVIRTLVRASTVKGGATASALSAALSPPVEPEVFSRYLAELVTAEILGRRGRGGSSRYYAIEGARPYFLPVSASPAGAGSDAAEPPTPAAARTMDVRVDAPSEAPAQPASVSESARGSETLSESAAVSATAPARVGSAEMVIPAVAAAAHAPLREEPEPGSAADAPTVGSASEPVPAQSVDRGERAETDPAVAPLTTSVPPEPVSATARAFLTTAPTPTPAPAADTAAAPGGALVADDLPAEAGPTAAFVSEPAASDPVSSAEAPVPDLGIDGGSIEPVFAAASTGTRPVVPAPGSDAQPAASVNAMPRDRSLRRSVQIVSAVFVAVAALGAAYWLGLDRRPMPIGAAPAALSPTAPIRPAPTTAPAPLPAGPTLSVAAHSPQPAAADPAVEVRSVSARPISEEASAVPHVADAVDVPPGAPASPALAASSALPASSTDARAPLAPSPVSRSEATPTPPMPVDAAETNEAASSPLKHLAGDRLSSLPSRPGAYLLLDDSWIRLDLVAVHGLDVTGSIDIRQVHAGAADPARVAARILVDMPASAPLRPISSLRLAVVSNPATATTSPTPKPVLIPTRLTRTGGREFTLTRAAYGFVPLQYIPTGVTEISPTVTVLSDSRPLAAGHYLVFANGKVWEFATR
jgi:hypothetical protein